MLVIVIPHCVFLSVIATDYLPDFYDKVNDFWKREKNASLKHVTVISLGGGDRDLIVNYHLTRVDGLVNPMRSISANVSCF